MLKAEFATRVVRAGLMVFLVLALGACTVGYQADVRNDTAQPIGVAIIRADASGQSNNLAVTRIAPKSRGKLVRNGVPHDMKVYLEADAMGNPGWPVQMDLKTGLTVVRVTQDGDVPTGKLRMERIEGE
ncbi:MAG: hypothetical protein JNK16_10885 [Phycisphaerales bacterium]|nr:hypothetical protein [Phycisphaerales bacterium]